MKSDNYGLHDGCIYKKLEECEYTYIDCTSVKKYLLNLWGNFEIADIKISYQSPKSIVTFSNEL